MAKKKHFLRYSSKSDTLEAYSGRKRPGGSGWNEILVNPCCPGQVGGCTFESIEIPTDTPISIDGDIPANCSVTVSLQWDGVDVGVPFNANGDDSMFDVVASLSTQFAGLAVFTYNPELRTITVKVSACGLFGIFVDAVCGI